MLESNKVISPLRRWDSERPELDPCVRLRLRFTTVRTRRKVSSRSYQLSGCKSIQGVLATWFNRRSPEVYHHSLCSWPRIRAEWWKGVGRQLPDALNSLRCDNTAHIHSCMQRLTVQLKHEAMRSLGARLSLTPGFGSCLWSWVARSAGRAALLGGECPWRWLPGSGCGPRLGCSVLMSYTGIEEPAFVRVTMTADCCERPMPPYCQLGRYNTTE